MANEGHLGAQGGQLGAQGSHLGTQDVSLGLREVFLGLREASCGLMKAIWGLMEAIWAEFGDSGVKGGDPFCDPTHGSSAHICMSCVSSMKLCVFETHAIRFTTSDIYYI